jgi:23S rRNA (uracil1939-C5)-methyltransferase
MANIFQKSSKKQSLDQIVDVKIERLDINGCGVTRLKKKPVFIEKTLPGERVKIQIFEQKSKYSRANIIELIQTSENRVEASCLHYHLCGGCDLQHLTFSEHLAFKQQKVSELFERNHIDQSLPWQNPIVSKPWHYRRKARIGVQYDKKGDVTLGFRKKNTNQLVAIKNCPILDEKIASLFSPLKKIISDLSIGRSIGHIEVIVTDEINIVIRQLKKLNIADVTLWKNASEVNKWQIFIDDGQKVTPLTDVKPLTYTLLNELELTFETGDFIQINHEVNLDMVKRSLEWLSLATTDVVLDLFCGLGNFSLSLAQQVDQVVGIEGVQTMVDRAALNARNNQLTNCQFYQADLNANWLSNNWAKISFDKVLLDPARAGALEAVEQLVKLSIPKILYVSCDPATLARDAKCLIDHGYKLEKIALIDMFSQTKHTETMVLFSRSAK